MKTFFFGHHQFLVEKIEIAQGLSLSKSGPDRVFFLLMHNAMNCYSVTFCVRLTFIVFLFNNFNAYELREVADEG